MELTRDQLLEIVDAKNGDLNTVEIPIDSITEGITIPRTLTVSAAGRIRHIPAIEVKTLIISGGSSKREEPATIEIASGFRADHIQIDCPDVGITFGDNIHIAEDLKVDWCQRLVFGDDLFVGRKISLDCVPGGVKFGRRLRVGHGIDCQEQYLEKHRASIEFAEDSEVAFDYARPDTNQIGLSLRHCQIDRLPARSKFYCSVWSSSPLQIDEDVYIAGDLRLYSPDARSVRFQNTLHVGGTLSIGTNGGEIFIPDDSQLGDLNIYSDPDAPVTYLRFGEGVHIKDWQYAIMASIVNIPPRFKVDTGYICGDASALAEVATDAYLGGNVKLFKYPLKHWPIKDNYGALNLAESEVIALEPGTVIHGNLDLSNSQVRELVDVVVEGDLILEGSNIERLHNVSVEGSLFIRGCPYLRFLEEVAVKGTISIGGTTPTRVLRSLGFTECTGLIWYFAEGSDFRQLLQDLLQVLDVAARPVRLQECSPVHLELQFD